MGGLVVQDVNKDSSGYEDILKAGFDSGLWYEMEEDQMEIVVGNPTYMRHEMYRDMRSLRCQVEVHVEAWAAIEGEGKACVSWLSGNETMAGDTCTY